MSGHGHKDIIIAIIVSCFDVLDIFNKDYLKARCFSVQFV